MTINSILMFLIFFSSHYLKGQEFGNRVEKDRMTIEGTTRKGFSTYFDFSPKVVEKSWWNYTRKFARPLDMKSYYKVTISGTENLRFVDIELLSKTVSTRGGSKFFLTLDDQNIPSEKKASYTSQVNQILKDFKQEFYIDLLEKKLKVAEKRARDLSKKVEKNGNNSLVQQLMAEERKMEKIREDMQKIWDDEEF